MFEFTLFIIQKRSICQKGSKERIFAGFTNHETVKGLLTHLKFMYRSLNILSSIKATRSIYKKNKHINLKHKKLQACKTHPLSLALKTPVRAVMERRVEASPRLAAASFPLSARRRPTQPTWRAKTDFNFRSFRFSFLCISEITLC